MAHLGKWLWKHELTSICRPFSQKWILSMRNFLIWDPSLISDIKLSITGNETWKASGVCFIFLSLFHASSVGHLQQTASFNECKIMTHYFLWLATGWRCCGNYHCCVRKCWGNYGSFIYEKMGWWGSIWGGCRNGGCLRGKHDKIADFIVWPLEHRQVLKCVSLGLTKRQKKYA